MARPRKPLIAKRHLAQVALGIIDEEGLDALSLKRLAADLGVHESSVYHHYRYKSLILGDVVRLVLSPVDTSQRPPTDWRTYLFDEGVAYYRILAAHPNLVPVIQGLSRPAFSHPTENRTAEILLDAGFPPRYVMLVREQLESLILGAVQFSGDHGLFPDVAPEFPALRQVSDAAAEFSSEERVTEALGAFLDGIALRLPQWHSLAGPSGGAEIAASP